MHPHKPDLHVNHLKGAPVSKLVPYAGLILTISCVIIFAARFYLFEGYVAKLYGSKYTRLSVTQKRTFINHHVAGSIKLLLVLAAAYPFLAVVAGTSDLHSPFAGSKYVKMGDVLLVISEVFTTMYIFELFYRVKVSPISALHHVGAMVIAQSAIVLGLDPAHEREGTIEFVLCLVWGEF